jgi:AcrR family transcriptional regulator
LARHPACGWPAEAGEHAQPASPDAGFHATSMQDLLREANLSAGAVYRYFKSKDEIIAAIGEDCPSIADDQGNAATRSPPPQF